MADDRLTEIFLAQNIKQSRKDLEIDFNNNFDTHEKVLSVIVDGIGTLANFNRFASASIVWNISGYLDLVSYDRKSLAETSCLPKKIGKESYMPGKLTCLFMRV